jgi:anti-sigma B factor antagonist
MQPMLMETEEVAPGVTKANLDGRLDIGGVAKIDLPFNAIAASRRSLIVDMTKVAFVASLGLRLLIVAARTAQRRGGRMVLLLPVPDVEAVLVSSGTDQVVRIARSLDEALHAVAG